MRTSSFWGQKFFAANIGFKGSLFDAPFSGMFFEAYEPKKYEFPMYQDPYRTTTTKEDFDCALPCSMARTYSQRY